MKLNTPDENIGTLLDWLLVPFKMVDERIAEWNYSALNTTAWPYAWRRLFVFTAPVSWPLLMAVILTFWSIRTVNFLIAAACFLTVGLTGIVLFFIADWANTMLKKPDATRD